MIYSINTGIQQLFVDDSNYVNIISFIESANEQIKLASNINIKPIVTTVISVDNFKLGGIIIDISLN